MKTDLIRYLIVGCARSGTTVLDQAVAGHPEASAIHDEIKADPFFTRGLSTFTCGHHRKDEQEKGWQTLFDAIAGINRVEETRAIGIKCATSSLQRAEAIARNADKIDPKLHVIFINRADLAAQYGSLLRARQTGIWHSWNRGKIPTVQSLNPDLSSFSRYASECLGIHSEFRQLKERLPFMEVSYEHDIVRDLPGCISRIFEFLGLPPVEPVWVKSRKVSPDPATFINRYADMVAETDRLRGGGSPRRRSPRMYVRHAGLCLSEIRNVISAYSPKSKKKDPSKCGS